MNKNTLLTSIHTGHAQFLAFLEELSKEQVEHPGVVGKWSVIDIISHIAIHAERMVGWIEERLRGRLPTAPQPYGMPEEELAILNEEIYQANRGRPYAAVLLDLERAHSRALALVETAREEDLFDPGCFPLKDGEPLWEAVAANTFWHYEEHTRDIRSWLAQQEQCGQ